MLSLYLSLVNTEEQMELIARVYTEHRRLMKYIALSVLEREEQAEEVVHDVMVELIELVRAGKALRAEDVKGLVCVLTRHRARDVRRKEHREKTVSLEDEHLRTLAAPEGEAKYSYEDLLTALAELPEAYRQILKLRVQYDLSAKELAKVLGISHANASKRLQRAQEALRKKWRNLDV